MSEPTRDSERAALLLAQPWVEWAFARVTNPPPTEYYTDASVRDVTEAREAVRVALSDRSTDG
jgi:hypothetical protein